MLKALPRKPDWFETDEILSIAGVPGIQLDPKGWTYHIHRSMLPLIPSDEAARILQSPLPSDWEARDRLTEPRGFTLRRVQHSAVDFITRRRSTLLGDDPRLGKTASALMSHDPSRGRLVIVAPLMVRQVWLDWIAKVFPGEDVGIMTGRTFHPSEVQKPIVFGHYDIISGWEYGDKIGTLVLDEAHLCINRNSKRTKAAVYLAAFAEMTIALTGTPIWNMPPDLWSVLGLVAPGAFGNYYEFCDRYGAPEPTPYGKRYTGISNEVELVQRLTEVMLRRRWIDVQDDLPPITRNVLIVDLKPSEKRKLDVIAHGLQESSTNTAGMLARYRDALSLIKLEATAQEAARCLERGIPCVVWTYHKGLAEALVDRLATLEHHALLITGDVPVEDREAILVEWRQGTSALVATMAVAQVGIDLSHSHRPIFAEVDYTPALIAQTEMRTFSPMRAMNVTYIIVDHFIDRKIIAALQRKLEAATPLGVAAGADAILALDSAFRAPEEAPDFDRFLADLLAS